MYHVIQMMRATLNSIVAKVASDLHYHKEILAEKESYYAVKLEPPLNSDTSICYISIIIQKRQQGMFK